MKRYSAIIAFCIIGVGILSPCFTYAQTGNIKPIEHVGFSNIRITDSFWRPRIERHVTHTLPSCINQIENVTGRIRNFENAAKHTGKHSGIFYDDSDVYKAMEGMAYSLSYKQNPELEAKFDEWTDKIASAQQPDGYLNTYYTLNAPNERWKDMHMHEMYCAGHLMEAATAYYQITGKRKLLDVASKMADHMTDIFGPGKRHWVTGHEEVELGLVKLYEATKNKKYLDFAQWLLDERGHGYGATTPRSGWNKWNPDYAQDDVPVRAITDIKGHAVRAMYLYCGIADVAATKDDTSYLPALKRVWEDVVERNMYITGGIGQSASNEGFTTDYSLPNLTAYCETCASVGMCFWNMRMHEFTGESKYIDIVEKALYNGVLAGVSLQGDKFFYVNPLESEGNHHRQAWYGTACCPSQIARMLPSVGNYIYSLSKDAIRVNMFIGNSADISIASHKVSLDMQTLYPWNGVVTLRINADGKVNQALKIRMPSWCKGFSIMRNGKKQPYQTDRGYAVVKKWKDGDVFTINMDMPVEIMAADERVKEDEGMRAIQRGPLVYCMEEVDNPLCYDSFVLSDKTLFEVTDDSICQNPIKSIVAESADGTKAKFVPYYSWDNRKAGKMKVWVTFNE